MDDEELLELISERKTISKTVEDYEGRKSTSLTTAVSVLCLSCLICCTLWYFCIAVSLITKCRLNCTLFCFILPFSLLIRPDWLIFWVRTWCATKG